MTGSGLDVISDWAISPVTIYWHAPWHSDEVTADSSNSLTLVLFSHRASYFYLLILFPCLVPTEALRLAQEVTEASCCIWSLTLTVEQNFKTQCIPLTCKSSNYVLPFPVLPTSWPQTQLLLNGWLFIATQACNPIGKTTRRTDWCP